MGILGRKKEIEKSEIEVLTEFLKNTANLTYTPNLYKDNLERALLLVKNKKEKYVLVGQENKFSEVESATKYAIEEGVGFRINVVDDENYRGKIGISPLLKKLYGVDEKKKIKLGILDLAPAEEENLEALSLKMYKEDAAMFLGPARVEKAEKGVVEPIKTKFLIITPEEEEKKKKTVAAQIEEELKPYIKKKPEEQKIQK